MIPYRTDPSLHDHEPAPVLLDDGFSPPTGGEPDLEEVGESAPARGVPPSPGVRES